MPAGTPQTNDPDAPGCLEFFLLFCLFVSQTVTGFAVLLPGLHYAHGMPWRTALHASVVSVLLFASGFMAGLLTLALSTYLAKAYRDNQDPNPVRIQ